MFLVTESATKAAHMYGDILGYCENITFQVKTAVDTFWATFAKIRQLFISASGHTAYHLPTFVPTYIRNKI